MCAHVGLALHMVLVQICTVALFLCDVCSHVLYVSTQLLTKDLGTPMGHNAAFLALGDPAGPVFTEDLPVRGLDWKVAQCQTVWPCHALS